MAKGQDFERWFCKRLSEWWSRDERGDLFWRTSNSGGRATVRGGKGLMTTGHHGDVAATDAEGLPLLEFLTIELKRGYNDATILQLLEPKTRKKCQYAQWIEKAEKVRVAAGAKYWMLVHRPDRKTPFVYFPYQMSQFLPTLWKYPNCYANVITLQVPEEEWHIMAISLEDFFYSAPENFGKR